MIAENILSLFTSIIDNLAPMKTIQKKTRNNNESEAGKKLRKEIKDQQKVVEEVNSVEEHRYL